MGCFDPGAGGARREANVLTGDLVTTVTQSLNLAQQTFDIRGGIGQRRLRLEVGAWPAHREPLLPDALQLFGSHCEQDATLVNGISPAREIRGNRARCTHFSQRG